ncbi:MAG: aldehyde ferredoxin oxidoreductase C-terminal domain-containing protein, partial [Candidatus Bathyarchaeia archaeon]
KEIADKITTLARMFNVREGISRKDDALPSRFFSEAFSKGPSAQQVVDKVEFEKMLNEYYAKRRWNLDGIPKGLSFQSRFYLKTLRGHVKNGFDSIRLYA